MICFTDGKPEVHTGKLPPQDHTQLGDGKGRMQILPSGLASDSVAENSLWPEGSCFQRPKLTDEARGVSIWDGPGHPWKHIFVQGVQFQKLSS